MSGTYRQAQPAIRSEPREAPGVRTLLLTGRDVATLLDVDGCIAAVERALELAAEGHATSPGMLGTHVEGGGFHVKTAGITSDRVFTAKVNANFPRNRERHGLPTIQGVIVLFDSGDGRPLAVLDSSEVTSRRTAAVTAVAAKLLARRDAAAVTVCGCGEQGRAQLRALARVRALHTVFAYDVDTACRERYATAMSQELGVTVSPVDDLAGATRRSDIIVTCTTAGRWILARDDVRAGTFVAAVGADHPEKQEIEPALLAASTVVVDSLDQCATSGDLHHALTLGLMRRDSVHAELSHVVAGTRPGRTSEDEVIVFDSTGTAIADVAAATLVYQRALAARVGLTIDLGRGGTAEAEGSGVDGSGVDGSGADTSGAPR